MSDVGSYGGGDSGGGVALPDAPLGPSVPSGSDLNSDRGPNKVRVGLDGKDVKSRDRGRGDDDGERAPSEADRKGKANRDTDRAIRKAHAQATHKAAQKDAARAGRALAHDPGDTSVAPAGFSAAAREAWSKTDGEVRSEVYRRQRELEHGLAQYKARAQRDYALDDWHRLAAQARTTVPQYLRQALSVELGLISTNPAEKVQALDHCLGIAGVSRAEFVEFCRTDTPQAAQARATNLQLGQVAARTEQLGRATADVAYSQMVNTNAQHIGATVNGFASAVGHDRFEELSADVAAAIRADPDQSGSPDARLQRAWDRVAGRRGRGSRSISGSPGSGVDVTPRRRDKPSIDDSLKRAFRSAGM